MTRESGTDPAVHPTLPARQVWAMATLFLAVGLAMGYLIPGSQPSVSAARSVAATAPAVPGAHAMGNAHMPSLEEMKQMADQKAAPLLGKLKSDPNNVGLLLQVGAIYHVTHQFSDAATYYGRAAQIQPRDVAIRTKLAASLFREGDADGAMAQLNQALTYDPKDANTLFNLGMIRLEGKGDTEGALAAWQQLLKSNPQLSPDRKATVVKLMADVMTMANGQQATEGAGRHDRHATSND
jgi:cytochrome c-type biogenesis protein CcmH/NrfG